jgi:hypothetical protein
MAIELTKTPLQHFSKLLARLRHIQQIQVDLRGITVRHLEIKLTYLNYSYVLHLVAAWEAFVEELVSFGLRHAVPASGGGLLFAVAAERLEEDLKRFHAPTPKNIDELFRRALGIRKLTAAWQLDELGPHDCCRIVDALLKARNEVAHTGKTSYALSLEQNFATMDRLYRIAELTQEEVVRRVRSAPPDVSCGSEDEVAPVG